MRLRSRQARLGALAMLVSVLAGATASARPTIDMGSGRGFAQTRPVAIQFTAFDPAHVSVLAGDTVRWSDISRQHTVTEAGGAWSSGTLGDGDSYSRQFNRAGVVHYYCQIHPFMQGEIEVSDLLLTGADAGAGAGAGGFAAPGKPYPLRGRAALPPGATVTIEADSGAGFAPAATATVMDDGSFVAVLRPTATAAYRAVSGEMVSGTVVVRVLDHHVLLRDARRGGIDDLTVGVTPAAPGATVVLQLHLKERFGWWPELRKRLDKASQAHFALRLDRRVKARVTLTLPDGATQLARSQVVLVGRARK